MRLAFRVAAKKAPLAVARLSFGITKLRSLRLNWRFLVTTEITQLV